MATQTTSIEKIDCVLTGECEKKEKAWGKDCTDHLIVELKLRVADGSSSQEYRAELPLVYNVGKMFGFYDKNKQSSVVRPATVSDATNAIDYAKKVFPAWAQHLANLPEGSTYSDAFRWFFDGSCKGAPCRAKLAERPYVDKNTNETKVSYEAVLWPSASSFSLDDFDKAFGASLKAIGFKIGSKVNKAVKVASAASAHANAAKPSAPKPPTPPVPTAAPSSSEKEYTGKDSWNAYEKNCTKNDPKGAKYWDLVKQLTGKEPSDNASFTSDDWKKCIDAWEGNF